jgi:hypothetical protein
MHNLHKCTIPITVTLPNGQTVKVRIVGLVKLNQHITLHNVFYIPTFIYNIISVSKLLNGTTISLILTTSLCIFQYQNKRITLGNLCNGLYFLSTPHTPSTTSSTVLHSSRPQLWHSRLCHPSYSVPKKIKCLSHLLPNNSETQCNVCHL